MSINIISRMVLPALFSALLFGCGGGGGGGGGGNSAPTTATGVFVDSPVAGLAYTSGGLSGVTSADGSFTCEAGQPVRFSIGNLQLPSGTCVTGAVVTPLTIFGTADINDIRVVNLARFLQTLDQNGYPDDGINIAAQVSSNAANLPATLDFGSNTFDTDVSAFFSDVSNAGLTSNTTLVSAVSATEHLQKQFSSIAGSWFTDNGRKALITFYATGEYVHSASGTQEPNGQTGAERGTYTWNPVTGAFVSTCPTVDTNGEWGLSHQTPGVCSGFSAIVTVSGNTLKLGNEATLARVVDAINPIVGSWSVTTDGNGGGALITFFANGDYVHAQSGTDPGGQDGIERGTYTWNPATGAFVSPCPTVDTNGEWGLSHPNPGVCSGSNFTLKVSRNTLNIHEVTLVRVVP